MTRPSNRELKALTHLELKTAAGPADFPDIGEKTFAGMERKGWVRRAGDGFEITPKGHAVHVAEYHKGRFKH